MADIEFSIQVGNKEFADIVSGFNEVERLLNTAFNKSAGSITRLLRRSLDMIAAKMQEQHGTPWRPGGSPPGNLYRRSGRGLRGLRSSIKVRQAHKIKDVRGSIRAPFPISVHEEGATIRPRSAQYLTIPLEAALDSRGVPRKRSARQWDNTFVAKSKRGNLIIFQKRGTDIVPLYVLKRQVQLPPRLGFLKAANDVALGYFETKMFETINREIDRALGT